jgi:hypothetical protein
MWNHSAVMADSMEARGVKCPTFDGSELVDLIAYLESVAPEPVEGGASTSFPVGPTRAESSWSKSAAFNAMASRGSAVTSVRAMDQPTRCFFIR